MHLKICEEGSSPVKCHHHKRHKTETRKLSKAMDVFISLAVVMVTGVYTYVQAHQIIYINMSSFLYTNYTSINLVKIKLIFSHYLKMRVTIVCLFFGNICILSFIALLL